VSVLTHPSDLLRLAELDRWAQAPKAKPAPTRQTAFHEDTVVSANVPQQLVSSAHPVTGKRPWPA